jgi:hypothetical protein
MENDYTDMLLNCAEAMFFHSVQYRNVLTDTVSAEPYYFIAIENGRIVGALPSFLKINNRYGNILNSLPFFGSHGGFLVRSEFPLNKKVEIKNKLLEQFVSTAHKNRCILSTIITSPLDTDIDFYEKNIGYQFKDKRIAPIIRFKDNILDSEREILYSIIEPDLRRTIRRPIKHGIIIETSDDFKPLYEMNYGNLTSMNSIAQPLEYFKNIKNKVDNNYYQLLYAKQDNSIIAGLLLFLFNKVVIYSVPAQKKEYSTEQANSLLIYTGMVKAINDSYKCWNFGGTSEEQVSLHKFKSRWGTTDYPYYYYITRYANIDHIFAMEKAQLLQEYQWFYVLPFGELKTTSRKSG